MIPITDLKITDDIGPVTDLSAHVNAEGMKPSPVRRGSPRPLEVWNADLPFDGSDGSKNRPVVVLGKCGGGYDVMMVTTHPHAPGTFMKPMEPYEAGLDSRSHVRTDRKFRIPEARFNYYMGDLGDDDAAVVEAKYERMKGARWTRTNWRRRSSSLPRTACAWT